MRGWSRGYIDPVANGYRVLLGKSDKWDEKHQQQLLDEIKKTEPSIPTDKIKFRKRTGHGHYAGMIDIIIPRADDTRLLLNGDK